MEQVCSRLQPVGVADEHRDAFVKEVIVPDKRTALDDAVAQLRSGMISASPAGALAQAHGVRAEPSALGCHRAVVTYGGPDLGLLCSAGKVNGSTTGSSLDSPPFRPVVRARPHQRRDPRPGDGRACCAAVLQAAAQRLPFLPIRAGLGARYHSSGQASCRRRRRIRRLVWYETLIAMPALRLDAAFAANLGDSHDVRPTPASTPTSTISS